MITLSALGRHDARTPRQPGRLRGAAMLTIALMLLGGTLVASAQTSTPAADACPAGTPASGAESAEPCVGIGEYDIYFNPNLITIPADTAVNAIITNHGVTLHNFSITDHKNSGLKNLEIDVDTDPGATNDVTINAPEGDYYFFCNVPGHEAAGMFGYLSVKADATISSEEATVTPRAG